MRQLVLEYYMLGLLKHHNAQLELCKISEQIADSLPSEIDRQECLSLARSIYPIQKRAHEFEEKNIFPVLRCIKSNAEQIEQTLERLKFEHWEDESFSEKISASLLNFVREPEKHKADSLSYMLRGFFEGVRRHIAFEVEHLLPQLYSDEN
jgi:hemerythrin-like domain-containing protein